VFLCFIKPRGAPEPPPPSEQMLSRMRRTKAAEAAETDDDGKWCVGSRLEALDQTVSTAHVWRKASVLAIDGKGPSRMVKVHFKGWNTRYDEWLTISGGRLRQGKKPEGPRAEEPGAKRKKGAKQTAVASEAEAAAEEEEAEGSREVEGDGETCVQCAWGDDEAGNELLLCDGPSCDAAFHQRCVAAW